MSLYNALKTISRITEVRRSVVFNNFSNLKFKNFNFNQERGFRATYAQIMRVMKARRKVAGPEKPRKRSDWYDWNYDAELYAFGKRLHENISRETLRCVFINDSYVRLEEQKRKEMNMDDVEFNLKSNSALVVRGEEILNAFLLNYLRVNFELVPEDGIRSICSYLTSDPVLSHVSFNLGTKDLIFSAEYPPNESTLAATFKALIAGIESCDSAARAENFILDFVCPQLIGKDIFDIWDVEEPLQVLNNILQQQGQDPAESRLIFESGRNTLEAVYHVGVYSNKQFLGRGVGETLNFAEEMAAYDALRRIFDLRESKMPLLLGEKARTFDFKSVRENLSHGQMSLEQ